MYCSRKYLKNDDWKSKTIKKYIEEKRKRFKTPV